MCFVRGEKEGLDVGQIQRGGDGKGTGWHPLQGNLGTVRLQGVNVRCVAATAQLC